MDKNFKNKKFTWLQNSKMVELKNWFKKNQKWIIATKTEHYV